jgi:anthranilate synthase component 2
MLPQNEFICELMRILLLDNYDSFTYMLKDYIEQCGASCDVFRNDDVMPEHIDKTYHALVISPGPCTPQQSGQTMSLIHQLHNSLPILGVCLGHQAIGEYFGAKLTKAGAPVHGKQSDVHTEPDVLFQNIPEQFSVTRYHSLILTDVFTPLETIAKTAYNEVMAIRHKSLPIRGVQFHPESCLTEHGLKLIKNFLTLAAH